jgi:hypothetical protein
MLINKSLSVVLLLSISLFLNSNRANQYSINSKLSYLKNFSGQYPNKVKLLGNNPLTKRLKTLLKSRYDFLIKTWGPETPIEVNKNTFIAWGCQQHNCSNTNFIIAVDFAKNVVYVGIREEENVKIYSEDGSKNLEITKWSNRTN